ncbi:hypothetical protein PsorP6_016302 [Peronosclerospora sorghi]|uniref:Uncharacterized protein n=1 Tax=Peronosclerospora sorghi TaxID=230839 RepID=A0ACC0VP49_9STRA|nr:hypothetical protein PsorP6_016302 [Peronosclerospora sorghi]
MEYQENCPNHNLAIEAFKWIIYRANKTTAKVVHVLRCIIIHALKVDPKLAPFLIRLLDALRIITLLNWPPYPCNSLLRNPKDNHAFLMQLLILARGICSFVILRE